MNKWTAEYVDEINRWRQKNEATIEDAAKHFKVSKGSIYVAMSKFKRSAKLTIKPKAKTAKAASSLETSTITDNTHAAMILIPIIELKKLFKSVWS